MLGQRYLIRQVLFFRLKHSPPSIMIAISHQPLTLHRPTVFKEPNKQSLIILGGRRAWLFLAQAYELLLFKRKLGTGTCDLRSDRGWIAKIANIECVRSFSCASRLHSTSQPRIGFVTSQLDCFENAPIKNDPFCRFFWLPRPITAHRSNKIRPGIVFLLPTDYLDMNRITGCITIIQAQASGW